MMKNRMADLTRIARCHPRSVVSAVAIAFAASTWLASCQVATSFKDDGLEFDFTGEIYRPSDVVQGDDPDRGD